MNHPKIGDHHKGEIEIVKKNLVYENKYAKVYDDDVIFPSGKTGKYIRFLWKAPYGVIILPKNTNGHILLIKNFRHEKRAWSWEVPKGFGMDDLSPIECAQKELYEETGYHGKNWSLFKTLQGNPKNYIYETTIDEPLQRAHPEEGEAIEEIKFFTDAELPDLLKSNMVSDPLTMFFIAHTLSAN